MILFHVSDENFIPVVVVGLDVDVGEVSCIVESDGVMVVASVGAVDAK